MADMSTREDVDGFLDAAFGFVPEKKATVTRVATVPTAPTERPLASMTASDREWLEVWAKKGRPNPANVAALAKALELLPGFHLTCGLFLVPLDGTAVYDYQAEVYKRIYGKGLDPHRWGKGPETRIASLYASDKEKDPGKEKRVRELYAKRVQVVKNPPARPEPDVIYGTPLREKKRGEYGGRELVSELWVGANGSMLTTPLGTLFIPAPVAGRGKSRKPEPWNQVTNKAYLKRLYMALYEAKLYQIAKAALEGKQATFNPKTREVRQVLQQRSPLVEKVLRELTDRTYRSVIEANAKGYRNELSLWQKAADERGGKFPPEDYYRKVLKMEKIPAGSLLFRLLESSGPYREETYKVRSDAEKTIHERAVQEADDIRDQFLYKNGGKLGAIVNMKDRAGVKLQGAEILRVSGGVYEGDIRFTFSDGSSFTVRNQTVGKANAQGTFFYQFPTTFHDVVLPDGSLMREPSEERMQKVFAAA
jgi:hypothetical protein